MTTQRPAFYAATGSRSGDLLALMHVPYTMWNLSYVVIGAALAPRVDAWLLVGTVLAFILGLGIGAHALDELHGRPLGTQLSSWTLRVLGWGGLAGGALIAVAAAFVISPVALVWGTFAVILAAAYALERPRWIHTTAGFAFAWGAFPVLVGYWAQVQSVRLPAIIVASAAAVFSIVQRTLSTPARQIRRGAPDAYAEGGGERWERSKLLATWERSLLLLVLAHVLFAAGLLATHGYG